MRIADERRRCAARTSRSVATFANPITTIKPDTPVSQNAILRVVVSTPLPASGVSSTPRSSAAAICSVAATRLPPGAMRPTTETILRNGSLSQPGSLRMAVVTGTQTSTEVGEWPLNPEGMTPAIW